MENTQYILDMILVVLDQKNFENKETIKNLYEKLYDFMADMDFKIQNTNMRESLLKSAYVGFCIWSDEYIQNNIQEIEGINYELLQFKYFYTTNGGNLFFDEMKKLNKNDKESDEIRKLYLVFLKIGFKGKYYNDPLGLSKIYRDHLVINHDNHDNIFITNSENKEKNKSIIIKFITQNYFKYGIPILVSAVCMIIMQKNIIDFAEKITRLY
jgi:type VI protein secretion system component VasF